MKQDDIDRRLVVDATPALILSARSDGYVDYFNKRWLEYLGVTLEAIEGWRWTDFVHPDEAGELLQRWRSSIKTGEPLESEARVRRADGRWRAMLHRIYPLCDPSGNAIRWFGASVDIEDRKQAERELRTIVETIPAYVWTARPDGTIDFIAQSWFDHMGHRREEVLENWTSVIHHDDVERVVEGWRTAVAHGRPFEVEMRGANAAGEYRWLLSRAVPLRDDSGAVIRWYGTLADIDELRKLKEELHKENIALRDEVSQASMFEEIVGSSAALRRVLVLVGRVAATDSTVLITGETGTGKELIARAIHKRSPRSSRPFISVNCGAIAPSLIMSELFGYEKGAFTGAVQRHLGRFELAEGGTIFLDEVGELPQETQIALLRVLQERTFERVGGTKLIPADVRVIAATNRDLDKAIGDGSFRSDLYYRLSVFPVHMPPLRDRAEDIPLLVEYLTERYAAKVGKKITSVSRRTMELLTAYGWPGNVRELQNVIQRAVILCDGDTLVVDETSLPARDARLTIGGRGLGRPKFSEEKEMIESALAGSKGRVAGRDGAAAKLGVPRSTLESRIRTLRINKNRFKSE
jgi:formate hydrogenlyase transcriptional activator